MATFTLQIVFSFIFIAPRFMQCTNSSKVKCTHNYSRNTCYSHSYLISHALCCTYKMSKYWLKGPIKYEDTWKPVFGHKKHVNFQKGTPPGGLEPPTFRLTAERASRLRHGGMWCFPVFGCNLTKIKIFPWKKLSTRMGFEPTRAEPIGLAVQRLNHSATSSAAWSVGLLNNRFYFSG